MLKKGLKLNSILTGSCPRCNEENMFVDKNPYHLTNVYKMHEKCSHCGTKYNMEPSFFYGAMYVSYALGVAFAIAAFVVAFLIFNSSLKEAFVAIVVTLVVLMPVIMRLSRTIWINMFISFDKNWKENLKK
ncbi:MAG TPA: DUF983 domain-containing protein [Flavobacterium sp.]|nr:DUF983 domain-containing protein [Flavobacterium sp.]